MNMDCNGITHVIKSGDTLYNLSRQYGVRLVDVLRANPYVNVYNLRIGEEICIPTVESDMDREYYKVKMGDTFGTVINNTENDIGQLFSNNKELYDMKLPVGMILKI